ncbi:hypothetical protein ES705_11544 [subsurface metagenome]
MKMKKILLFVFSVLLMFAAATTLSQDKEALLKAHMRNFEMVGIEVKIQILEEAAASGVKELGPLYIQALDFVLSNTALIPVDGRLRQMVILAAGQILEHEGLEDNRKAEVAEFAMDMALHMRLTDSIQRVIAREIRFEAAKALMERKWSRATPLAIEHFDATLLEYERGVSTKNSFLEAIATLGSMGSHDAAVRLTQYLLILNSYSEKVKSADDQIILAVIVNLGGLGDKVAFDDLMYVGYLNYTSQIKKAARKSLENLKW